MTRASPTIPDTCPLCHTRGDIADHHQEGIVIVRCLTCGAEGYHDGTDWEWSSAASLDRAERIAAGAAR